MYHTTCTKIQSIKFKLFSPPQIAQKDGNRKNSVNSTELMQDAYVKMEKLTTELIAILTGTVIAKKLTKSMIKTSTFGKREMELKKSSFVLRPTKNGLTTIKETAQPEKLH